ncbi:MAG: RNA polymerase sigma factor SigJ [Actinomycetota bacterium]|nr:RNA polymerase sigma factor SigJ [Actinomycetota bacterium]
MDAQRAAEIFAEQRGYLLGVSYRLTGSWVDAEDLVAEAWPRWERHAAEITEPRAWLTRVVGRLSLDHLRSARVRRETYVGPWLPEPLVTAASATGGGSSRGSGSGSLGSGGANDTETDPLEILVRDESVRMAFLVVLDQLSPEQRLAVVLHDALGMEFADVAEVIGCSVATARQHGSRGRRRLSEADPPPRAAAELAWSVLGDLSDALVAGDVGRLSELLAPDVVLLSDGAGEVSAARRPVVGAGEVGRFLLGLAKKYGAGSSMEPILVNGDPALLVRLDSSRPRDPKIGVYTFGLRAGQIVGLYAVLAPDKLTRLT